MTLLDEKSVHSGRSAPDRPVKAATPGPCENPVLRSTANKEEVAAFLQSTLEKRGINGWDTVYLLNTREYQFNHFDASKVRLDDDRLLAQKLKDSGGSVMLLTDPHVEKACIPVLIKPEAPIPPPPAYLLGHRVQMSPIQGVIYSGRYFEASELADLHEYLIESRNNIARELEIKRRLQRAPDPVRYDLDARCHDLHNTSKLVGILAKISPPETDYRIALKSGAIRAGKHQVAVRHEDEDTIEIVLPCVSTHTNAREGMWDQGEKKKHVDAFEKQALCAFGGDFNMKYENFWIAHRDEADTYYLPVVYLKKTRLQDMLPLISDLMDLIK